jgi:signal transduction histidine kinase
MFRRHSITLSLLIAGTWLALSAGLASWWVFFYLQQMEKFRSQNSNLDINLARLHRMFISEGAALFLLLLIGAAALFYVIYVERRRSQQIQEFFATFTHELKTSIASVRLQVESLQEDLGPSPHDKIVGRLVDDTVRLEVQLENSLYLARGHEDQIFMEPLSLRKQLDLFRHHWPNLRIDMDRDTEVMADRRALESILKNLIQNAVVHGNAKCVTVKVERAPEAVLVKISDDGTGYRGETARLGELFRRHNARSGSGIGLYLVRHLMELCGGGCEFTIEGGQFLCRLRFLPALKRENS